MKKISGMTHFKELFTHGKNYLTANLAAKALAFISIPVYTRLLSTEEYGVVSIFLSVSGILASIMALSMDRSISRYYFDQEDLEDFRQFNGTTLVLTVAAFLISSTLLVLFSNTLEQTLKLKRELIYLLIPITLINIIVLTFHQIYGPQKKSKIVAKTSLFKVYAGFALSTIFLLLLSSDKYFGIIFGQILAGSLLSIYIIKIIRPYFKICFHKKYIKYIFTYSIPLIPYALSGVIIAEFGKIAIGSEVGLTDAGLYTIAQTIGSLVVIMITVTHQAWNPYFYEYMNTKNYAQIDIDFVRIFKITLLFAYFIASFGSVLGLLLAKGDFTKSLYLVPVFTIGYVFYQLSYAFLRNFAYFKRTYYMSITVIASGLFNVALNSLLIPLFGELGASLSLVGSYIFMFLLAWALNTFFVKLHSTSLRKLLIPLIISIPFYGFLFGMSFINMNVFSIALKIALFAIFLIIMLYSEKDSINIIFSQLKNKYLKSNPN